MNKERAKKRREQYDIRKFICGDAELRYEKTFLSKSLIAERGFHNPGGRVEGNIENRNWHYFTQTPSPAVVPLVREFYSNLPEHRDDTVFVRGKWVKFDKTTINLLYQLEDIDVDQYSIFHSKPIDYELIIRYLCGGDTRINWKRKDNKVINFPASGLTSVSKAWHYFITGRLMPSGNTSEVTRERAVLNYLIQINHSIDVGRIIRNSILGSITASYSVGLGHPSLIHELCVSQGVTFLPHEEIHHPKSAITKQKISSYSSRISFEPGESSSQRSRSPPSSRSKTVSLSDQVGQLKDKVQDLSDHMKEHNKWHENLDAKMTHYLDQQTQHYEYVSDFNSSLAQMFTNCSLNIGPSRVEFPEPPIYSYYDNPREEEEEDENEDEYED